MLDAEYTLINEEFHAELVTPEELDRLLNDGWRHFGTYFFRYSLALYRFEIRRVVPLRIRLEGFSFSKSQRRVLQKNKDLNVTIAPADLSFEKMALFDRHKQRFKEAVPNSVYDFLSADPANTPSRSLELSARLGDDLLASSFFDIGENSVSSIYAMFEPCVTDRSLGIFTLLKEIEFALEDGKSFFHLGYSYEGESFYDYKKRFRATEAYDWTGVWRPLDLEKKLRAET
jgi:arginine-tRNA-protein transferase